MLKRLETISLYIPGQVKVWLLCRGAMPCVLFFHKGTARQKDLVECAAPQIERYYRTANRVGKGNGWGSNQEAYPRRDKEAYPTWNQDVKARAPLVRRDPGWSSG